MDRKIIFNTFYKNRFLVLSCSVLIAGTIFGTSVLKFLPEEICENLFAFVSQNTDNFTSGFFNKFSFPFMILFGLYLAGFSVLGNITSLAMLFINGAFFGFENGLNYMFSGTDYILNGVISYFTATLYFGFMLIIMAESSIFSSRQIINRIQSKNTENSHYKAKNQTVKFITFTLIFAAFSAFSAYFSLFIQSVL